MKILEDIHRGKPMSCVPFHQTNRLVMYNSGEVWGGKKTVWER